MTVFTKLRAKSKDSRSSHQSFDRLAAFARRLAESDCSGLKQAVSDLAHGKLSAHLAIESKPVEIEKFRDCEELAGALNAIVGVLRQTAAEFNTMTETPCRRLCYVGADSYIEGMLCGQTMGKHTGGRGKVAVITSPGSMSLEMRLAGFQARLHETFPGIELARVVYCATGVDRIQEEVSIETRTLIETIPQLAGLYVTRGSLPPAVARAVEAAGAAGRIMVVAHDLLDETMKFLQKGVITAALGQDPFAQGHDPVIHLFNRLTAGWLPPSPRLLTRLDVVTRENCDQFWQAARGILVAEAARYASPAEVNSSRLLRFAVISRGDNPVFESINSGIAAAAAKIRPLNATVDLLIPEENRKSGTVSAEVYAPVIESVLQKRYDGFAVAIFDPGLVPLVNRAVASGVPVITFNSEPGGLRSMISSSIEQSGKLLEMGYGMAETVERVSSATHQVNDSIMEVSRGAVAQTERISQTRESIESLLRHVADVNRKAGEGAAAAESTAQSASAGTQAIEKTLLSMQQIHKAVVDTSQDVEKLGSNSDKIDGIIKTISTVAYQIKLLGINAAVEAAHAGQYGAGFSIVANEIRSLADRTAAATADIVEVVKTVQSSIRELQRVMESSLQIVKSGSQLAGQAGAALGEIRNSVEQNKGRLGSVAESASQMQEFSKHVGEMMEAVASVSERNAAASEEVSSSTQEMTTRLNALKQMAHDLAKIAEGEKDLLAKFASSDEA